MASSTSAHTSGFKKIRQLTNEDKKVNVIGVVASFRPPFKSRGNDHSCSFHLVDEDNQTVNCVVFHVYKEKLPKDCTPGDVMCLHRVDVHDFGGRLQVQGKKYSSWMLFRSGDPRMVPITSSESYTLSDTEKQRVKRLKMWASQNNVVTGPSNSSATVNSRGIIHQQVNDDSASSVNLQSVPTSHHNAPALATASATSSSTAYSSTASSPERIFKPKSPRFYNTSILKLVEVDPQSHATFGVCGVVKYYKAPSPSRGKDCFTVIGIVDESSPQKSFECVIFNPFQEKLPVVCHVGEIVLIKGLTFRKYHESISGFGHEHSLVGIFSSSPSAPIPSSLGTWYDMKPHELERIKALKQWVSDRGRFLLNTKFEEVTNLHYFNTYCRVASIATFSPLGLHVLGVYDGTSLKMPFRELDLSSSKFHWEVQNDPRACYMYQGLIVDVFVGECKDVEVGDFVELVNVLSLPVSPGSDSDPDSLPPVELKITKHNLYDGKVRVLPDSSPRVQQIINNLPKPYGPFPTWKPLVNAPKSIGTVLNRQSKQSATLKEIEDAPAGSVFCCDVEVVSAGPVPVEEFCQLRCSDCKMRYAIPKPEDLGSQDPGFLMLGDPCIYCNDSEEDTGTLKYMYVFTLRIRDSTGELEVFVSDKEGASLLPNLPPTNFYADQSSKQKLVDILYNLTGGNDPFYPLPLDRKFCYPRPLFSCSILSYVSQTQHRRYSLTETVL